VFFLKILKVEIDILPAHTVCLYVSF